MKNLSRDKAFINEKSMVASYRIAKGKLPPLQKKPSFSNDINRALEYLESLLK